MEHSIGKSRDTFARKMKFAKDATFFMSNLHLDETNDEHFDIMNKRDKMNATMVSFFHLLCFFFEQKLDFVYIFGTFVHV